MSLLATSRTPCLTSSFLITMLAYFSFFSIFSVLLTTTTIILTMKVPQIATKKIIKRPSGVWG